MIEEELPGEVPLQEALEEERLRSNGDVPPPDRKFLHSDLESVVEVLFRINKCE